MPKKTVLLTTILLFIGCGEKFPNLPPPISGQDIDHHRKEGGTEKEENRPLTFPSHTTPINFEQNRGLNAKHLIHCDYINTLRPHSTLNELFNILNLPENQCSENIEKIMRANKLDISNKKITSLDFLCEFKNLRKIDLSESIIENSLSVPFFCNNIEFIDLSKSTISDDVIIEFQYMRNLREINLSEIKNLKATIEFPDELNTLVYINTEFNTPTTNNIIKLKRLNNFLGTPQKFKEYIQTLNSNTSNICGSNELFNNDFNNFCKNIVTEIETGNNN